MYSEIEIVDKNSKMPPPLPGLWSYPVDLFDSTKLPREREDTHSLPPAAQRYATDYLKLWQKKKCLE